MIIDNAEKALRIACNKTGAIVNEYTVAPVFMDKNQKARHEWCIEFEKEPVEPEYFITVLDHALMAANSDYEAKRFKNITLDKPLVHIVKKKTFYHWFQKNNKLGGQNKIPRLSNKRRFVEEILEINKRLEKL